MSSQFELRALRLWRQENPDKLAYWPTREELLECLLNRMDALAAWSEALLDETCVPEPNCSCCISPPCQDCVAYANLREVTANLRTAIDKTKA